MKSLSVKMACLLGIQNEIQAVCGPNFLSQPKNLTAFSASSKPFAPAQKPILLNANHLCLAQNVCDCHNM